MTIFKASSIDIGVDPIEPTLKLDVGLDTSFFATHLKETEDLKLEKYFL
jgi:hypothetical protein